MASVTMNIERGRKPWNVFGVLRRGRTYLNLVYVLLALPLGYLYVVVFSTLWAMAVMAFTVVVTPVYVLACAWVLTYFERWLAHGLLGVSFTPMAPPLPAGVSLWERLKAYLRNPVTWKSLVYLIVRVPLGWVVSIGSAVLLAFSLAVVLAPALYLGAVALSANGWGGLQYSNDSAIPEAAAWLGIKGSVVPQFVAASVALTVAGIVLLAASLEVVNGVAGGWGWFARQMLGVSPKDLQLAEARAIAAQAHARAEQAEHGRRQLVLDASHELRTPVATIRAHIESLLLLEGERLPEQIRAYLAITQREAERLGTLVDDLLMLARADADELRLDIQPTAIGPIVEEVFHALEPLAERERQVTLVRHVAADLPPAYADRDRLAQVLLNLARNAITYTPAGGLVSLELAPSDESGMLALTVTDTGIGIADDDFEHIFERFYRSDASRARHSGGFGLGLSIVRDLVEAMGGTVTAEHVPEGGSRFRVTLRAAPPLA